MEEKDVKNAGQDIENVSIEQEPQAAATQESNMPGQAEIEKLQQEVAELKDKYLRQVAEFDNFRKRTAKERLELMQTAGKDVIMPLLDVLDDCDRAQQQLEKSEDVATVKEGVLLVFNKLRSTLNARGVKKMESVNQEFNPDLHEAITEVPASAEELKGKVLDEVQKGYYLNDKLIRHAKVVVGK
jgi:molecular chaperone GrpE